VCTIRLSCFVLGVLLVAGPVALQFLLQILFNDTERKPFKICHVGVIYFSSREKNLCNVTLLAVSTP
jgi:hypothetical protein